MKQVETNYTQKRTVEAISLLIYPLITHPCNSIDIINLLLSQLIHSDIIHHLPSHHVKLVFSKSRQLTVPVEKDLWIETS